MKLVSKSIGIFKIILSLLWMGLAVLLLVYGLRTITWVEDQADLTIEAVIENIGFFNTLMTEITDVIEEVEHTLSTIEVSMIDGGLVLLESRPMVNNTQKLIIEGVPQALDDIQSSIPAVIQAARSIEQALTVLSSFNFAIPIPFSNDFQFSLGIDYAPDVSLEELLTNLGTSLQDIPDQMRVMESDFVSADINMSVMSGNLLDLAHNIDKVRGTLADITPAVKGLAANLEDVQSSLGTTRSSLPGFLKTVRSGITILAVLLLLTQIPSIYFGCQLLTDRAEDGKIEQPGEASNQDSPENGQTLSEDDGNS